MVIARPPAALTSEPHDFVQVTGPLWRLYNAGGAHPQHWNSLRYDGPLASARFDPHPPTGGGGTLSMGNRVGVSYAAGDSLTPFAEVYQHERVIRPTRNSVSLVLWQPTRPLLLLDLRRNWLYRHGSAVAAIHEDDKALTREWARAIENTFGSVIDGILYPGAMIGKDAYALLTRTELVPSYPNAPLFHARLSDPYAQPFIHDAVKQLNVESV